MRTGTCIANSLNNLAATLWAKGELVEAERLHREALDLLRAALPAGHADIATSLNNLATVLIHQAQVASEQGKFVQAKRLRREAAALGAALPERGAPPS